MPLDFQITRRSYSIGIEEKDFLDLLASESHVTGNAAYQEGAKTLLSSLEELSGVHSIEYGGHFGSAVYLTIDDESDCPWLHARIWLSGISG